jgi:hypothetical protein
MATVEKTTYEAPGQRGSPVEVKQRYQGGAGVDQLLTTLHSAATRSRASGARRTR